MRSRIRYWLSSPISFPRWLLTVKYALFVILGITGLSAGLPTLSLTTPAWYIPAWSWLIISCSVVAAVASTQPKWASTERWGAVGLVGTLASYWFAAFLLFITGDMNRGSFSVLLFIVTVLPALRAADLFGVREWFVRMFKKDKK